MRRACLYRSAPSVCRVGIAAAVLVAAACRATTASERARGDACPQTYEFGNYGCARVVALIDGPPRPWPDPYRFEARLTPARPSPAGSATSPTSTFASTVPLQYTLWSPLAPAGTDTLSVWVVARMLEDPQPAVVGVPLPLFAADSVLRVLRFAPVGSVPPTDSARLTLRRP